MTARQTVFSDRGILSGGDHRFAVSPSPNTGRIRAGFTDYDEWDCWECDISAPGTSLLHVRTRSYVRGACNSELHADFVSIRRSSTGFDYCLVKPVKPPSSDEGEPLDFRLITISNRIVCQLEGSLGNLGQASKHRLGLCCRIHLGFL